MALSSAEVLHIAKLADLTLTKEEVERLTGELGAILAHVEQLQELDTTNVEPTAHVSLRQLPYRPDSVVPGLDNEKATGGGARVIGGAFAVPKFVEE